MDIKTKNVFLARLGLIKNNLKCELCDDEKAKSYVKRKSSFDGFICSCVKSCRKFYCLSKSSHFEGCRLDMFSTFKIMYKYLYKILYSQIEKDLEISRVTVYKYVDKIERLFVSI
ncbi:hypothetical protein DMUE_1876 [Dictyocoela muelleri]|nr:hypothetical protein DMUE_1876 [Dictyocoela muelleri]